MNNKELHNLGYSSIIVCMNCGRKKHAIPSSNDIMTDHQKYMSTLGHADKTSRCCSKPSYWWVISNE